MSGKEFYLIKELTYSGVTAICAFEPPFCAYLLCGSLLKILTNQVRVALATLDVQITLEISATDEIHMEDRNHGLAWTKANNGIYNTQQSQQTCA